ncbi:ATP-dependent DNA helicase srs2 [Sorochytrium milnesiophthora]
MVEQQQQLNARQHAAVTSTSPTTIVLAGPGSGKTKVITSRVAHLVMERGVDPARIVVVTFTNNGSKAANEMLARSENLIGSRGASKLQLGTFHALCAKYLRKYGHTIGLASNFSIANSHTSEKIAKEILTEVDGDSDMKVKQYLSLVSAAKAHSLNHKDYAKIHEKDRHFSLVAEFYNQYQQALAVQNLLDFDDLLMRGREVVAASYAITNSIDYVLVDEFQDTNTTQYELTLSLCSRCNNLTIVGDPDQSIYGWRNANITNLKQLMKQFPDANTIRLEENYRSTQGILTAACRIIEQDQKRLEKTLFTSNDAGHKVFMRMLSDANAEASFVAMEAQRLVKESKGFFTYSDIAVLVRAASLTRVLEDKLMEHQVPYNIVGGLRFFDREEVKDLMAYLQLCINPADTVSFKRAINTPTRGLGRAAVPKFLSKAQAMQTTPCDVVEQYASGQKMTGLERVSVTGSKEFTKVLLSLRQQLSEGRKIGDILLKLIADIDYVAYLRHVHKEDVSARVDNIQELATYASEFERNAHLEHQKEEEEPASSQHRLTTEQVLARFIETITLAASHDEGEAKEVNQCITISTLHSSKGLEWPIVFMVGVEELTETILQGFLPHVRATSPEQIDEERRLLYVGMTRARSLLYMTRASTRINYGQTFYREQSSFLTKISSEHYVDQPPSLTEAAVSAWAQLLKRPMPSEALPTTARTPDVSPSEPPSEPQSSPQLFESNRSASASSSSSQASANGIATTIRQMDIGKAFTPR